MKSVLVHAHDDNAMEGRLQVALDVCRTLGAHLTCLHVTPYNAYIAFDPLGGIATQGAILDGLRESETALRGRIETRLMREDIQWDWQSADGDIASMIVAASTLADLIIVSQHNGSDNAQNKPLPIADDVAVHADCAVLVVPTGVSQLHLEGDVVIGWNASPESAHAVRASIPILKHASSVHICSIGGDGEAYPQTEANTYLSRHSIASDLHELPGTHKDAARVLHDFATDKQASYLVMGAYGRSRLRETLLGGVTKNMISNSKIPLLLAH